MHEPAVEIVDLVKSYRSTAAVAGLSLTAARGAVTALLGPNGAGKTTTVEICEGFRRADSGRVRVLGLDPATDGGRLHPRIGVMLQDGVGYPGARAREMLRLVAAFARDPIQPDALLDALGLARVGAAPLRSLSGGERQRLSLAMAVVGRPELVILDEPTAGLDVAGRVTVWELIETLRADGVSVLLTTHNMAEAARLADRIVIVDAGRVVASGSPTELTSTSDGELRFRATPGLAVSEMLPAGREVVESPAGHYTVSGPADPGLVAALTAWCAQRGVLLEELQVGGRSLEDVFLGLTGKQP
ncbi:MAG TPA: ABC transporter ATP-binding protein [Mycobacteriales bacterium]|nr:ABC transporter ATP-binding protein [Mycobacteriales bacterium]